jgi:hypothetical protein
MNPIFLVASEQGLVGTWAAEETESVGQWSVRHRTDGCAQRRSH